MERNKVMGYLRLKGYSVTQAAKAAGISRQYAQMLVDGFTPSPGNAAKARDFWDTVAEITGQPPTQLAPDLYEAETAA